MKTVYWLASYPKSGSTWVRWLLANLLNEEEDISINSLPNLYRGVGPLISSQDRRVIDSALGFYSSDLWLNELPTFRLLGLKKLLLGLEDNGCIIKVHELRRGGMQGCDLFFTGVRHKVIHVVRDPRDVVLSYASFSGVSLANAVEWLLSEKHMSPEYDNAASNSFRVCLGSWASHFHSWHMPDAQGYLMVRYEDLSGDTSAVLSEIASHLGVAVSESDVEKAVLNCTFEKARSIEKYEGFNESMDKSRAFFRKGKSGAWRADLDKVYVERISNQFHDELKFLNYPSR